MTEYKEFVNLLDSELELFRNQPKECWKQTALKYVNGFAGDELRRLVTLEKRRESGTFFTHSDLGKKVLSLLKPNFTKDSIVYDPACGASNLLISVADYLREKQGILNFENQLLGTDIHSVFIETSRLRLHINQLIYSDNLSDKSIFDENIIAMNGLLFNKFYETATHIIVNPPFNQIPSENNLSWAKGKVSNAAIFIDKIIQHSKSGVSIIAILPDVLRSGSRYEKWRNLVEENCKIEKIKLLGQFDKYADVDVFALKLTKRKKSRVIKSFSKIWQSNNSKSDKVLSDLFDICVGPVVDNRDPHEGNSLKYIVSKGLMGWNETKNTELTRRHKGKSFASPFVVIKRTSRMSDSNRAIATIINFTDSVYVDNHLIILKPKSGKILDCRKVLYLLKSERTDDWINSQIRCRHLTTKVISDLPIIYE